MIGPMKFYKILEHLSRPNTYFLILPRGRTVNGQSLKQPPNQNRQNSLKLEELTLLLLKVFKLVPKERANQKAESENQPRRHCFRAC